MINTTSNEVKNRLVQFGNPKSMGKVCSSKCMHFMAFPWENFSLMIIKLSNTSIKLFPNIFSGSKNTIQVCQIFKFLSNSIPNVFEDL